MPFEVGVFWLGVGVGAILAVWGQAELERLRPKPIDRPWGAKEWRTIFERDRPEEADENLRDLPA